MLEGSIFQKNFSDMLRLLKSGTDHVCVGLGASGLRSYMDRNRWIDPEASCSKSYTQSVPDIYISFVHIYVFMCVFIV